MKLTSVIKIVRMTGVECFLQTLRTYATRVFVYNYNFVLTFIELRA